jgi:hypothetical protein
MKRLFSVILFFLFFELLNCKCENNNKNDELIKSELKKIHDNILEYYRSLYVLSCNNCFPIVLGHIVINGIKYCNGEVGIFYIKNKLHNDGNHYVVCFAEPNIKKSKEFKLSVQFDEWLHLHELDNIVTKTEKININDFIITKKHLKQQVNVLMEDIKLSP